MEKVEAWSDPYGDKEVSDESALEPDPKSNKMNGETPIHFSGL